MKPIYIEFYSGASQMTLQLLKKTVALKILFLNSYDKLTIFLYFHLKYGRYRHEKIQSTHFEYCKQMSE